MNPVFSVVVAARTSRAGLALLLRCLEAQTLPRDQFECIVVDDAPRDRAALPRHRPGIDLQIVEQPVGLSPAHARNRAFQQSRGDIVVFLDGDMLPTPGWLAAYAAAFAEHELDVLAGEHAHLPITSLTHCGAELAALLGLDSAEQLFEQQAPAQFAALSRHVRPGHTPDPATMRLAAELTALWTSHADSMLWAYAFNAANSAVRRAALAQTTGFNPFLQTLDDLELGLRLWERGARFGVAPGAAAYRLYQPAPEAGPDPLAHQACFYLHPYQLVMLAHLWQRYQQPDAPRPGSAVFHSLRALAEASRAGDWIDLSAELGKFYKRSAAADAYFSTAEMIAYYHDTSGITPAQIAAYLDLALRHGLFVERRRDQVFFNVYHTNIWLRQHTPYQQHLWLHESYGRVRKTPFQRTGRPTDLQMVYCAGHYAIDLPASALTSTATGGVLSIPLPIEHLCQTRVRITSCSPPDLLDYAGADRGMIVQYPLRLSGAADLRISYEFECIIHEYTTLARPDPVALPEHQRRRFLQPTYTARYLTKARALLAMIDPRADAPPYDQARAIYTWLLDHCILRETPFADPRMLDLGFGSCIHAARLFINLCRLRNIPAREQCGAFFSRVCEQSATPRLVSKTRGYSPFTHTWAEFYSPEHGWVPVEFMSWGYGKRALTARNVVDAGLRAEIIAETALYDNYYFGSMDPFRVYASPQVTTLPTYPLLRSVHGLLPPQHVLSQTSHTLSCQVQT